MPNSIVELMRPCGDKLHLVFQEDGRMSSAEMELVGGRRNNVAAYLPALNADNAEVYLERFGFWPVDDWKKVHLELAKEVNAKVARHGLFVEAIHKGAITLSLLTERHLPVPTAAMIVQKDENTRRFCLVREFVPDVSKSVLHDLNES